jgi:hypothetical protein
MMEACEACEKEIASRQILFTLQDFGVSETKKDTLFSETIDEIAFENIIDFEDRF